MRTIKKDYDLSLEFKHMHDKKMQRCIERYCDWSNFEFRENDDVNDNIFMHYSFNYMGKTVQLFASKKDIKKYLEQQGLWY